MPPQVSFRPSSHSHDYTIVAIYETSEEAKKAKEQVMKLLAEMEKDPNAYLVDWDPEEAEVSLKDNKLFFSVYTAGYLDEAERKIEATGPKKMNTYENYQELTIQITTPKGVTLETAGLILPAEEVSALKWLYTFLGKPTIKPHSDPDKQILEWKYSGDGIYNSLTNTIYLPNEINLFNRKNWKVIEE